MRLLFRGLNLIFRVSFFFLGALILEIRLSVLKLNYSEKQNARSRRATKHARSFLASFNISIECVSLEKLTHLKSNALIVANHLSFWDAFALSSIYPAIFITSIEVRDTPILGQIARGVGCLYVERRNRNYKDTELLKVSNELMQGRSVVLFPEATSSNGNEILPFKNTFFRAAVLADKPVLPACINYLKINGSKVTEGNRDTLFYYGDLNIVVQLFRLLQLRSATIEIRFLDPIFVQAKKDEALSSVSVFSTELCRNSYNEISKAYISIKS